MKTFDFIQATISNNLKDPHSKALEPDCVSPFALNYDTVSKGGVGVKFIADTDPFPHHSSCPTDRIAFSIVNLNRQVADLIQAKEHPVLPEETFATFCQVFSYDMKLATNGVLALRVSHYISPLRAAPTPSDLFYIKDRFDECSEAGGIVETARC